MALRGIDVHVIELPAVVVERDTKDVTSHGLPTFVVHRTVATHLEILRGLSTGRIGVIEGVGNRSARDRHLRKAAIAFGHCYAGDLEDRRRDVGHVVKLTSHLPLRRNSLGPMNDQGDVDSALVGVLFVPLERGVASLRPTPRIVRMTARTTNVIKVRHRLIGTFYYEVEVLHLVQDTKGSAFLTCAVVAHQQDQRVVEFTERREVVNETSNLRVSVFKKRGVRLLQTRREQLVIGG